MKRSILGLLVCLAFATVASAQVEEGTGGRLQPAYDSAPVSGCGSIDASKPCYYGGAGDYISCYAKGADGQMCAKGFPGLNGSYECAWVRSSASCQCDAKLKRSSGTCTYVR
jgi:hypothetical protein